ncbi:hypothetical protein [Mesorhizobium sp. CAU 1732]|uniref:hypothetical protein n=1 Tax=Mesorhizobium sp. CAU 1732 TaxID=3140358 RepID=UPI0032607884
MQNFGGFQQAFGPGVSAQVSRQKYLRHKYPGFSTEKAEQWDADRRRPLTPAEIILARSIYASAIRYDQVSVYQKNYRGIPLGAAHAPDGNIYFPPGTGYREDFGGATNYRQRSVFIHELCHVWQHQRGVILPVNIIIQWKPGIEQTSDGPKLRNSKNYIYAHMFQASDRRRLFTSLDLEAQAEFMSDYYLVKNGRLASMAENRGFSRSDYESSLPTAMRNAGVGTPTS